MEQNDFEKRLAQFCSKHFGTDGELSDILRLSGGASMESWAFTYGDHAYVLRRLPSGISSDDEGLRGISLETQADVIECARAAGVTAPTVKARLTPADELGEGFVMDRVVGETLPQRILGNPEFAAAEAALPEQCASELARIHAIERSLLPPALDELTPIQQIELQQSKYTEIGAAIPIYDLTFRWLRENVPETVEPRLVHGDFRMGNLMISSSGITAVLDWELARLGDPVQDIAYLCTPSWRFGRYDKVAGGFSSEEAFLQAYQSHSGYPVDRDRFRFWLVYSTLWWGVACLVMGEIWRSGGDRSLERTVIGRRVSEVEIDLALLLEPTLPASLSEPLDWQMPGAEQVRGETSFGELLEALGDWNRDHVQPDLKGHDRFQSRVAGNALGIAERQARWGARFSAAAADRLAKLGLDHAQLCRKLASGQLDASHAGIWDHLRLLALERLTIDQPKYAGLQAALKKWSTP